jgi:uncharacterized membrane protein YcaP (DUF421 family)
MAHRTFDGLERAMDWLSNIEWREMFVPTYSIPEIILRGMLTYLALFAIMRFLLKRQTGAVGIADLLVVVLIADAAQNAMGSEYRSVTEGVLLVLTIVTCDYVLDWAEYRFSWLRSLTRPGSLVLIREGRLIRRNMRQEMITEDELLAELRKEGVDNLDQIAEARMEGDGKISVIKTSDGKPSGRKNKSARPA